MRSKITKILITIIVYYTYTIPSQNKHFCKITTSCENKPADFAKQAHCFQSAARKCCLIKLKMFKMLPKMFKMLPSRQSLFVTVIAYKPMLCTVLWRHFQNFCKINFPCFICCPIYLLVLFVAQSTCLFYLLPVLFVACFICCPCRQSLVCHWDC